MTKILRIIALFVMMFSFSSNCFADIQVLSPRNVLIVGDSEACAVGSYAKQVAKEYGISDAVAIECKTSSTIGYWSNGNFERVLARHPKTEVVLVFLGTNHYSSIVPPRTQKLLSIINEKSLQCVWVGPVAVHGKSWPINEFLKQSVADTCSYFDTENANIELRDGVHPTQESAKKWLEQVWNVIPHKRTLHKN